MDGWALKSGLGGVKALMSTLLDQAKKIAQNNQEEAERKREVELRNETYLKNKARDLREALMIEINALDGQPSKVGTFYLEKKSHGDVACFLYGGRTISGRGHPQVLWVKSGVESGTFDGSDDCRDIPYRDAYLTLRVYPPNPGRNFNGQWDTEESQLYHNGGSTESISRMEDMPRMLKFLTEQLAAWVRP